MDDVIAIARALSDENRVRALLSIGDKEVCVCQLIELLQLSPSTVSKHMSILRQAKLVVGRKKGRWMYYRWSGNSSPSVVQQALLWVRQGAAGDQRILEDAERMAEILRMKREFISGRQSLRRKQTYMEEPDSRGKT